MFPIAMKYPVFLICGPPGSGKDTNATLLERDVPGLIHLGSGSHIIPSWMEYGKREGNARAIAYEAEYAQGKNLDDETIMSIFLPTVERMMRERRKQGAILNGYPGTVVQARSIPPETILGVLHLQCSDATAAERMRSRPGTRHKTPEAINNKIQNYHTNVVPTIEYFAGIGVPVHEFDAEGPIAEVYAPLRTHVRSAWKDYLRSLMNRS